MSTATRKNVALVKAGTWSASTGVTKITGDDLAAMVTAYGDHVVDRPVIKLGHDDNNPLNAAALGDGEPAFGWLANLSVGDGSADRPDVDTLYGDYVGMPSKLADVSDTAWRRRSVEIAWGVKTAAGKAYRAVLTGVALLGVRAPAVKGLGDVLALYSELDTAESVSAFELVDGIDDPAQVATLAAARAEVSALAAAHGLPATAVDAALERLDRFAGVRDTASVPPAPGDRPEGHPDTTTEVPQVTKEGTRMTIKKSDVDKALEAAGDEDVTAALEALLTPAPAEGVAPVEGQPAAVAPLATAASAAPAGAPETVTITASALAELQAGAAAGTAASEAIAKTRREGLITTALSEGRITPAERDGWATALEANEESTATLLAALTPRFAITEAGTPVAPSGATELSEADETALTNFTASLGLS